MIIEVDRSVYSDACITKCVYALSNDLDCRRTLCGERERIEVSPRAVDLSPAEVQHLFLCTLNDYKAREVIATETHDIRTILYAKAFADCDEFEEMAP